MAQWLDNDFCWVREGEDSDPQSLRPLVGSISALAKLDVKGFSEARSLAIRDSVGRTFTHAINIAAMCNDAVDHRILCRVVSGLAEQLDGIIDFDVLEAPVDELGMGKCSWAEDQAEYWTVVGDANSGKRWLTHPSFYMVK